MPELWDEAKGEWRKSIEDRQREDLELKLIYFQRDDVLPSDDKKARELLSRAQYHMERGVLYYVEADKTLIMPYSTNRQSYIYLKRHSMGNLLLI